MLFNENDPALSRRYGRVISIVAGVATALFLVGLARRSYWALAVPVATAVVGALGGSLVLGRLLATTPDEPPDPLA